MSVTPLVPIQQAPIPAASQPAYDAIVSLTDRFCQVRLTYEYQMLCRKLGGVLARKRPSPLTRGKAELWACAIVRVIGWVNYLDDSSQKPHMKLTAIDKAFGVAESTAQGKAKAIRTMLRIRPLDPMWSVGSRIKDNPADWMVEVNGFILDARVLRREIQEELHQKGVIPFIPTSRPSFTLHLIGREDPKELSDDDHPATQAIGNYEGDGGISFAPPR